MTSSQNPSHTPRLTVALIVRNDATGLGKTLQSVETIADEFVVVDTGSSDDTRDVARQYNGKVVEFQWCDDFSAARNHAISHATGDWILWLDSGETLSHADADALKQSLAGGQLDSSTAYIMVVKPPAALGVIAAEQVARIRLVPRRDGLRFQGRVRETLYDTIENLGLRIDGLPQRILRGPREHDETVKRARAERNRRLAEREASEHGRSPQLINCLAEAAAALGETERAIELYTECLDADPTASADRLEAYYGLLSALDAVPGARSSQLSLCVKALEEFPLDAQLLCAMGGYLQAEGRIELAARSYQTAYQYGRVNPLIWHLEEITAIAAVCHCTALQMPVADQPGDDDAALDVLQNAIAREGKLPRLCRALLELHIKHGRIDAALQQVPYVGAGEDAQSQLRTAVAGACLASRQQWPEALAKLQAAYDAGCRDAICLCWLTIVHLAQDHLEAAKDTAQRWRQLYPADPQPHRLLQSLEQNEPPGEGSIRRVDTPQADPPGHTAVVSGRIRR